MRNRWVPLFRILALSLVIMASAPVSAEVSDAQRPAVDEATDDPFKHLRENLVQFTLDNGLRVVFLKRDAGPVFSGELWVKAGGVDEKIGATGLAHFLEHMAFKGSEIIGTKDYTKEESLLKQFEALMEQSGGDLKTLEDPEVAKLYSQLNELWVDNEFGRIYTRAGGAGLNASTSKDYTNYTVSLPSNAFELWAWMESERLRAPVFRQFYKEKEVVLEERRQKFEDDPAGRLYELLLQTAYNAHPYRIPNIGYSADLKRVTVGEMREFYKTYYRPDNMVLAIVGNLEESVVRKLVSAYFGRLPKQRGELPTVSVVEPAQTEPRAAVLRINAKPQLMMAFHKPVFPNPDDAKFSVLRKLLSEGRTSIFEKELVREKKMAMAVNSFEAPGTRYSSLFVILAVPMPGVSSDSLRDEIQSILQGLQTREITEAELMSVKRRVLVELLEELRGDSELVSMLGMSELLWNDVMAVAQMYKTVVSTTVDDIRRLARDYLSENQRTYVKIETAQKKRGR